jgi:hypothetical protein
MLITFQINREASLGLAHQMDADEEDENAVFICVFHLRPSEFICG